MSKYRFEWKCSYLNQVWFMVHGDGESYEVRLRTRLCDYEASIYNGGPAKYRETNEPLVGLLMREHCYRRPPLSLDVVRAFNDWRRAENATTNAHFAANPHRYGEGATAELYWLARGAAHYGEGYEFYPLSNELVEA